MLEILKNHWYDILSLVMFLASILFFILKKPLGSSLESDYIADLSVLIAGWIQQVEVPGNGATKKETVISLCMKWLRKKYGREFTEDEETIWRKRISTLIELYLSTPEKKEISNASKTKKS